MTKTLDSTAVYAYTTLISAIVCLPFALGMEGHLLQSGAAVAIQKVRVWRWQCVGGAPCSGVQQPPLPWCT
jgi:diaminopimelate decarboxylase/solute carrier family 35 protein E1